MPSSNESQRQDGHSPHGETPPPAEFPRLETDRLLLRAFAPSDGPTVERLAGAREVADTTLSLPHPYPEGGGSGWIATHADAWRSGELLTLAVCRRSAPEPIGAVSLHIDRAHAHGEIGYWIGTEHWGQGYATEAARALVAYAFDRLGLHRVQARHFLRNPSSGRVMQKLGMQREGILRDAYVRWGRFESVAVYAVLAPEWSADGR